MKRAIKYLLIIIACYFVISSIVNLLGFLKLYNSPTTANEPNLKLKEKFFSSNLISPKKDDFICFKHSDTRLGDHIRVYRLVAVENDTVEIKNGVLYVNDKDTSSKYKLCHYYKLAKKQFNNLKKQNLIDNMINEHLDVYLKYIDQIDSINITFQDHVADSLNLTNFRQIDSVGKKSQYIQKTYNKNWNKDNFGPLIIGENKFFALGDNRDNAEDSRYIGQIDKSLLVGTVITK